MSDSIQWIWSDQHRDFYYTNQNGETHWRSPANTTEVDNSVIPRTFTHQPAQQQVNYSQSNLSQPNAYGPSQQQANYGQSNFSQPNTYGPSHQQVQYHEKQRRHHEEQERYQRSLDQYYGALGYVSPEQRAQYYSEQWQYHQAQFQYHQGEAMYYPNEAQTHRKRAEFHQEQARNQQLMQSQSAQPQVETHSQQAEYHGQLARYHLQQTLPSITTQPAPYQPVDDSRSQSLYNFSELNLSSPTSLLPNSVAMSRNYTHSSSGDGGGMDPAQPNRLVPVARIEATPGDRELLDSNYTVQRKPKKFFVIGRVFSVLWTEPTNNPGYGTEYTQVRFGQYVYSDIRRFVVIKESHDSCWCLPIHSYGKRATTKRAAKSEDHAIIYTGATPPEQMEGEVLYKKPLQVDVDNPKLKLDPASRINFGKIYTVEHNIKVCKIGKIAESSEYLLEAYSKEMYNK